MIDMMAPYVKIVSSTSELRFQIGGCKHVDELEVL
jgi:hypothetical protein